MVCTTRTVQHNLSQRQLRNCYIIYLQINHDLSEVCCYIINGAY